MKNEKKNTSHSIFQNHRLKCIYGIFFLLVFYTSNAQDKVIIKVEDTYQKMEGFGASDAWRCEFVGKYWPADKKEKMAELLFSKELDQFGNPKGIGLSIWRFYIGAGTAEQGEKSGIKNEWRRAESFIDNQGNYNWNKQKGQQWFLNKAKLYGVDKFLAFSISAPVQWTLNGKGYNGSSKDGHINLQDDKFDNYAEFMVDIVKHFKDQGVNFDYLSPINEPQWDWEKKSQEGTPATNNDILKLSNLLNEKLEKKNLTTQLVVGESADLRWLYSGFGKPKRGNQIDYFFGKNNRAKYLKQTISGHSYFTSWPVDSLISIRKKLNNKLTENNIGYWQSEFCVLEKNEDIGGGHKRDLGIDTALYVARLIHADVTLANASSWQWWTAISNANFKDGLIYLDTGDKNDLYNLKSLKTKGEFHASKLLWAFGNYSRFIRPGMTRVKIDLKNKLNLKERYQDVMLSAYVDKNTSKLVVVAVNYGKEDHVVDFSNYKMKQMYVTSKDENLRLKMLKDSVIKIKGRSINTLTGVL